MLRDMKQKISRRERESENMPSSSAQRSSVTQSLPREVDDDDVQSLVEQEECEELAQEEHMVENVAKWISEYCSSCDAERQELFAEGKRLSFV